MAKLIRKERNIFYEYHEHELTKEQLDLYLSDKEKFMEEYVWDDKLDGFNKEATEKKYIDTTDTEFYLDSEEEPKFNY